MKKRIGIDLLVLLLVMGVLVSCGEEAVTESRPVSSFAESLMTESESISSRAPSAEESNLAEPDNEFPVSLSVVPYDEADPDVILDQDGNEVIAFSFAQSVKEFHILAIDETDVPVIERHPDTENQDFSAGESVTFLLMLGETMATRGISFVGENGNTCEYAILYNGSGFGDDYFLVSVSELTGTEPIWEEIRKVGDCLMLAKNEYGNESLLYLHPDGTKTEIHRDSYLQEGFFAISPDGNRVLFNTYAWEAVADVYLYDVSAGEKHQLDLSGLHEEDTVAFMEWLDDRYFLFVSQYAQGTIVRGGDLYVYDTAADTYSLLVDRADDHLQIRSFFCEKDTLILDTPLYDESWNETVNRTYEFPLETVYDWIEKGDSSTLEVSGRLTFAIDVVEDVEGKEFLDATPGEPGNAPYVLTANQSVADVWVCEFFAGEYLENGWLYQISGGHYVGDVSAETPIYVIAAYTDITHRFGVSCLDENGARRFFAVYYNTYDGTLQVEDITDLV